jgi:hypothetical protein
MNIIKVVHGLISDNALIYMTKSFIVDMLCKTEEYNFITTMTLIELKHLASSRMLKDILFICMKNINNNENILENVISSNGYV